MHIDMIARVFFTGPRRAPCNEHDICHDHANISTCTSPRHMCRRTSQDHMHIDVTHVLFKRPTHAPCTWHQTYHDHAKISTCTSPCNNSRVLFKRQHKRACGLIVTHVLQACNLYSSKNMYAIPRYVIINACTLTSQSWCSLHSLQHMHAKLSHTLFTSAHAHWHHIVYCGVH